MSHLIELAETKNLKPLSQVFPFKKAKKAFQVLANRKAIGKIVLELNESPNL